MAIFVTTSLSLRAEDSDISNLESVLHSNLIPEFSNIITNRYYCVLGVDNEELKSQEESFDFFTRFFDKYFELLKENGMQEVVFYITFANDHPYECNLEFHNLHRITKYVNSFCVSSYQMDNSTDREEDSV